MATIVINGITYNLKKINETTYKAEIDDADLLLFAGSDGKMYHNTFEDFQTQLGGFISGFIGALGISDFPTLNGMYLPEESGTYPNAGGLVIDLEEGLNFIVKTGPSYTKIVIPIDLSGYATTESVALKADLGNAIEIQTPVTPLASMTTNGGGINFVIFNNFDTTSRREYDQVGLYNPSASPRDFQVAKLAIDGITITLYDTFNFPANSITDFDLGGVITCEPGERLGIKCLAVSFRNTANPSDIGSRVFNGTTWSTSPSTWGYRARAKSISYGDLKSASDAIDDILNGTKSFPKMLYSFDADGGSYAAGLMQVYVQFAEKSNYYTRFNIIHQLADTVGSPRADLWRIAGAVQCVYNLNANVMAETGKVLLQDAETEFVVRFDGDDDSVGGFHGNELLDEITFAADDNTISISSDIGLTKCTSFWYLQQSKMLKRSEVTPNEILGHTKKTTFLNSGFTTFNHIKGLNYPVGQTEINFNTQYSGLFTITTTIADFFMSETGDIITAAHVSTPAADKIMERRNKEVTYWSNANSLGAVVSSEMKYVTVNGLDKTYEFNNAELELQVWDTNIYTKYYRRVQEPEISAYAYKIGDVAESVGSVSFKMKS